MKLERQRLRAGHLRVADVAGLNALVLEKIEDKNLGASGNSIFDAKQKYLEEKTKDLIGSLRKVRKKKGTELLHALDATRDDIYLSFRDAFFSNRVMSDVNKQKAYKSLLPFVEGHTGMQSKDDKSESMELKNFTDKLSQEPYLTDMQTLGLTDWTLMMIESNTDFNDAFIAQSNNQDSSPSASSQKSPAWEAYMDFDRFVENEYIDRKTPFIEAVFTLIEEARKEYDDMISQRLGQKDDGEEDLKTE